MAQALRLAARARGRVEPNPMVGAVVVRGGRAVGEGYHKQFGGPHAEVLALQDAGRWTRGSTLYVTLEPCCHWGKTPPCTDAIQWAGVKRVVAAMIDPFGKVRGRGAKILRAAGIEVETGLMQEEARELNAPFIKRLGTGMPYVIAKWAQTIDGCVATARGESRWISSEESRADSQKLRGRVDAIIIGLGTAAKDDPLLMARPDSSRDIKRLATRIVLDSACRLPVGGQLVRTVAFAPLMVVHAAKLDAAAERRRAALAERGAMTVGIRMDKDGRPGIAALLKYLGDLEYTNVMVEGGPEIVAAFLRARCVDEARVYVAPMVMGGPGARRAIGGPDLSRLADAARMRLVSTEIIGGDAKLRYRIIP